MLGGDRKEIMCCGGTVIEDKLESFGSSKFSQNMLEVTRRASGFLVMMELTHPLTKHRENP